MKLLLDANLSPKLVQRLSDLFGLVEHVFDTGLARHTSDTLIWDYAAKNDFTIVTADADFINLVTERGFPPRVIRIEKCTYRTAEVAELIRRNSIRIVDFHQSEQPALILRKAPG